MSFMSDHMSVPQTTTAPSSIVLESSGTSVASFTVWTIPVPPQVLQAPVLLKASSSAPGPWNCPPQAGQVISCMAATERDGGQ